MKFVSTRGRAPAVPISEAILQGAAPDRGLYRPAEKARIDAAERLDLPGIFTSVHAAPVLFKDFDKECRELTKFLYTLRFGPDVEAAKLRPTQEALDVFRQTMR